MPLDQRSIRTSRGQGRASRQAPDERTRAMRVETTQDMPTPGAAMPGTRGARDELHTERAAACTRRGERRWTMTPSASPSSGSAPT